MDGGAPLGLQVAREKDNRHAAATQLALELVAAGEGGAQAIGDIHLQGRPGVENAQQ